MTIARLPGFGESRRPLQLPRRQLLQLGAGAALGGALHVGPARLVAQDRAPWWVFVSEHRADLGYVVEDIPQGQFASTYTSLGGSAVAGAGISARFRDGSGDPLCQAFERLVLHVSPVTRSVRPVPLLKMASEGGFDDFLEAEHGIPPAWTARAASSLGISGDFAEAYHAFGNWPVLGAPATPPVRVQGVVMQRFDNAVIRLPDGGGPEDAELAPVPLYLRAAGYFPDTPFLPRSLPVYPMEAPPVIRHGDATQPYLFVTVDDCWDPEMTSRALDIARDERIKITFFPVGTVLRTNPDLWRRAIFEGHSIENHTYSHLPLPDLSDGRIRWELDEAGRQVNSALGYAYPQLFMRPPLGAGIPDARNRLVRISQAAGLHIAMWTVDSKGWHYPRDGGTRAQDFVLGNLTEKLQTGAVLLLHALASDIAALPRLAREIHSAGLQSVNLRDQLHLPGQTIDNGDPSSTCPETLPDAAEWC
ncbi:MAG: polysaccharide deacetylase family protein [Chloroflexi bacterium]|nr:polysaccharide deacetylase family protein [Chloroflexota bacterium]